jgi:hypothetical protein
MKIITLLLIVISLHAPVCFAREITWDIGGVVDQGTYSTYDGKKVALGIFINGVEVGRVWDNPAARTVDIPLTIPNYYKIIGKLYFYAAPYPESPTGPPPPTLTGVTVSDYQHKQRTLDDGSAADIKRNRSKGRGLVSFGPAR